MLSKNKTIELFVHCPTCRKAFSKFDPNRVELVIVLDTVHVGEWVYCSQPCMELKTDNINWDKNDIYTLKVLSKERISESPQIWVITAEAELKFELL